MTEADPGLRADAPARDFIRQRVADDLAQGRHPSGVVTRFPPEPNGHLHIGHAKSVCLNFGVAEEFPGGRCFMRFDDTNPSKEDMEYVQGILDDVRWLGFDWGERLTHASDYFDRLYAFAEDLIGQGRAYVDSLSADRIREFRGTLTEPGRESPWRGRSVEENLDLFRRMRDGEFAEGAHVLRARIDMTSPNLNMRDPVMYRILHQPHQMTGDAWCIYPMYDFAHCVSDALEGITHSLCTLEFEDHRPLYDWFLDHLDVPCHPQQIEVSRLNLSHTVMSKRVLNALVEEGHVDGWDDPRMPTLSGLRRRGYTPAAIRDFCSRIGVSKSDNNVELAMLESVLREHLDGDAPRALAVLDPVKLVIESYPEEAEELFEVPNHPARPDLGTRRVPFSRELWIEHGGSAAQVLPPRTRARGAAALRLLRDLHRGRQGSRLGAGGRDSLHPRPAEPRRWHAGRAQGQGHAALGLGAPRARCQGAALRHAVRGPESGCGAPCGAARRAAERGFTERTHRLQAGGLARRRDGGPALSVRTPGLLLPGRARRAARRAGLQPRGGASRQLGEAARALRAGAQAPALAPGRTVQAARSARPRAASAPVGPAARRAGSCCAPSRRCTASGVSDAIAHGSVAILGRRIRVTPAQSPRSRSRPRLRFTTSSVCPRERTSPWMRGP
jgi:glutaminyl-tRNA synthetase